MFDLPRCIEIRKRGLSYQPFRDELLGELGSISRRMGVPLDRIKVGIVPVVSSESPASAGTRLVPGSHAYVVLPDSFLSNVALSRIRDQTAVDTLDMEPNDSTHILTPADRFAIAHEFAHLRNEDFAARFALAALSAALSVAMAPFASVVLGWSFRAGSVAAMWSIPPAFFGYKWSCREQERAADAAAAAAGYAQGGLAFFDFQLRLRAGSPVGSGGGGMTLWRSHPTLLERFLFFRDVVANMPESGDESLRAS